MTGYETALFFGCVAVAAIPALLNRAFPLPCTRQPVDPNRVVSCHTGGLHDFQPRYDLNGPKGRMDLGHGGISSADLVAILKASSSSTYVCDVCTACGKTVRIERPAS